MRKAVIESSANEDLLFWAKNDLKILKKIILLIDDTLNNPFGGIGKPEPLKHNLKGYWSKRINDEHRMVYKVTDEFIYIAQCRKHYEE
jgi:toxin YoeB